MKDFLINNTNNYHYIDYDQQIIPIKNDVRTTYNFGHRNYIVNDIVAPPLPSIRDVCKVLGNREARYDYTTETRKQMTWKSPISYDQKADLAIPCKKPQFVQTAQEFIFRNPPKPITLKSGYSQDYNIKPQQYAETVKSNDIPYKSPARPHHNVYANKPGHYK